MKPELKHLTPYLPFALEMEWSGGGVSTLVVEETSSDVDEVGFKLALFSYVETKNLKLLLRDLSNLTNPITHNGETFIPMKRFVSMLETEDYIDYVLMDGKFENPKYQIDDGWNHTISFSTNEEAQFELSYGYGSFMLNINGAPESFSNQLEMFEKLYEWGFDVFGLIDKGLAIEKEEGVE